MRGFGIHFCFQTAAIEYINYLKVLPRLGLKYNSHAYTLHWWVGFQVLKRVGNHVCCHLSHCVWQNAPDGMLQVYFLCNLMIHDLCSVSRRYRLQSCNILWAPETHCAENIRLIIDIRILLLQMLDFVVYSRRLLGLNCWFLECIWWFRENIYRRWMSNGRIQELS